VSGPVSGLDSVSVTVRTPGTNCSFNVSSQDGGAEGAECRRRGGDEEERADEGRGRERGEEEEEEAGADYLGTDRLGVEEGGNKDGASKEGGNKEGGNKEGGNKEGGQVFTCVMDQLEPGTSYQLEIQSHRDQETGNITMHTSKSSSSPRPGHT